MDSNDDKINAINLKENTDSVTQNKTYSNHVTTVYTAENECEGVNLRHKQKDDIQPDSCEEVSKTLNNENCEGSNSSKESTKYSDQMCTKDTNSVSPTPNACEINTAEVTGNMNPESQNSDHNSSNKSLNTSHNISEIKSPVITSNALSQLLDYGMSDTEDSESDSVSISDSSDTNSDLSDEIVVKPVSTETNMDRYREGETSSDSSTYYDSDSSSDSGGNEACAISPAPNNKAKPTPKMQATVTKGELTLEDLPPIEQLQISVPEQECVQIGVVSSIVEQLVIVQSLQGIPAYDIDTLLFLDKGSKPLGRIFDVLGPVTEPFYAVRFNSYEQAMEAGVKPGTAVYSAPYNPEHTAYVFVSELLKIKGSDASWKHNNEPPDMFLDYSDDEQEARAKSKRHGKSSTSDITKSNSLERNKKFERQMNNKNILMNERFNQPSTSRRQVSEPDRRQYQQIPNTPQNWTVPQAPRAVQRPEFCMPYQYGYFNHFGNFPVMPQFGMPPMVGPNVFHPAQPFNPHVPPPIMRPQPVSYFPNPRHTRWGPPNTITNSIIQPPRPNFGNGSLNQ